MAKQILLSIYSLLLLTACQVQKYPLPESQKLSIEKVAKIAVTIDQKYSELSAETRSRLLNTVVQSLDNMVFVEGGEFQMGDFGWPYDDDPTNMCGWPCGVEPDRMGRISIHSDDDFVHPVKLSSYSLSKYQTTLRDFDLFFIAQGKPLFDAENRKREDLKEIIYAPNLPAPTKSWQEAKEYCGWLGGLSGFPVDLPTEAQWEYAARNRGQHVVFSTDNGSLNYGRNFPSSGKGKRLTFAVDSFVPNPLGIYNLSGNATDWVNDWYEKDYYRRSPLENPTGPETGTLRALRGSGYGEAPLISASTVRRWGEEPVRKRHVPGFSFRCAVQSDQSL
ncbi:formylglycine-generating enzyme family protein [Pseudomonas tussilaginis]|uniref:formylglycine-generating enzyme family protein n=1 Tax=unclassified Pseudomonas TaxID=196821 RepID=UPI000C6DC74A|nr:MULTISPECIES: SUMF1/EgtB/PvdO family nonheme iron enzyme [unclassified Pseudomonas]QYX46319.1 formylglycine-generating enzyme family protein [Pseudomonas sp. S11A 273]